MKKLLILSALSITTLVFSQSNFETLKKENESLQSTNKVLTSENEYLKKALEINKPLLETERDNSSFKITKVTGNKAEKSIAVTFLMEAKDENKKMIISFSLLCEVDNAPSMLVCFNHRGYGRKITNNYNSKV